MIYIVAASINILIKRKYKFEFMADLRLETKAHNFQGYSKGGWECTPLKLCFINQMNEIDIPAITINF